MHGIEAPKETAKSIEVGSDVNTGPDIDDDDDGDEADDDDDDDEDNDDDDNDEGDDAALNALVNVVEGRLGVPKVKKELHNRS